VISISDQSSMSFYPPFAQASSGAAAPKVPISPGSQQISVQITVVYSIG